MRPVFIFLRGTDVHHRIAGVLHQSREVGQFARLHLQDAAQTQQQDYNNPASVHS